MHLEHPHRVSRDEAIRRINALLDDLMRRPLPAGVTVKDVSRNWSGPNLQFSVSARKGLFGATLSGTVRVNDDSVVLDCDLPGMVTAFVAEEKIRDAIHQQLDSVFPD
jgi:hypothetical protein